LNEVQAAEGRIFAMKNGATVLWTGLPAGEFRDIGSAAELNRLYTVVGGGD